LSNRRGEYYFGSYGLVRGYGPLYRTLHEADESVYEDSRLQRRNGGSSDRCVALVAKLTGLCWWWEEGDNREEDMVPVRTAQGEQARYTLETIKGYEGLWAAPTELAGFA
jgi:hypothetical protein